MQNEYKLLIGALGLAVAGKSFQMPDEVDWERFLYLAKAHGLEAMAGQGLKTNTAVWDVVPEKVRSYLDMTYFRAICREAQLDYIHGQLKKRLEDAQIPHVFLKGICLKADYPVPALRTMCDIDVLARTEDYKRIAEVAESLQAEAYSGDGNHLNFKFPGGVAVEFHPNLLHPGTPFNTGINPGWQYTEGEAPSKEMNAEGMYLNTICHLAEHFVASGVGVKFVLDIWVCRNLRKKQYDRGFVERELARFGLLEFARNIEALAEAWFGSGEMTEVLEELGEYILSSGSHGLSQRAMLNAVALSPGGNRTSALLKKVFYPKEELETRFPWCKGKPYLLPAAWCARAYGAVTKRGHLIAKWSKGTAEVSEEQVNEQRQKLSRFGIRRKTNKE